MRKPWLWLAALLTLGAACVAIFVLDTGEAHTLVERALGETPQAKVEAYLSAIRRADRQAALARWPANPSLGAEFEARRLRVTDELLALGSSLTYRITGIEWWSNCCEPRPIDSSASAGVARLRLEITGGKGAPREYIFDVTTDGPYWGEAGSNPVRHWALRDVYSPAERPLAFPPTSEPPTPAAIATPVALALPGPTPTPEATGTPAPLPTAEAAVTAGPAPQDLAGVLTALPAALAKYPGDLGALLAIVSGWGALETASTPWQVADLAGDGTAVALLLLAPPSAGQTELATLLGGRALVALEKRGDAYAVADSRTYEPARRLAVPLVRDLNGDGRPEVLVTYEDCGAHTCFLHVEVLAWEGGRFRDLSGGPRPIFMSYAELEVKDRNGDGRDEIALHGGEIGSVGAGPVQTRTEVYAWDGQAFELAETIYDPSTVRVHVLFDGDRALRRGDLAAALAAYQRVADDPTLTQTGLSDDARERHTLEALARYRLLTAQAAAGDRAGAAQTLATLQARYADYPCAPLAQAFYDAWHTTSDLAAGCAAATAYAEAHPEVLASFGEYGYGNPSYQLEDICFLEPSPR